MNYTTKQIENAKKNYNSFLRIETLSDYAIEIIGTCVAEQRLEFHNNIVTSILNGNKELETKWKLFFLNEEVKADQKAEESKVKKTANKEDSAYILAPIKEMKKLGEYGKWLNTSGNKFRKEFFNKKYTVESVNAFLNTL